MNSQKEAEGPLSGSVLWQQESETSADYFTLKKKKEDGGG